MAPSSQRSGAWLGSRMTWKNIKGLFWQPDSEQAPASAEASAEMTDAEFAEFLANDEFGVSPDNDGLPAGEAPIDVSSVVVDASSGSLSIDFQAQYDSAQIPNTDEVEQVEAFLSRLDGSLPQASKLAAAEAFLGAVGKSSADVLQDAERKIHVVRRLVAGKEAAHQSDVEAEQSAIAELEQQIEARRQKVEQSTKELEGFRGACVIEEARLQAARVFFGHVAEAASDKTPAGESA